MDRRLTQDAGIWLSASRRTAIRAARRRLSLEALLEERIYQRLVSDRALERGVERHLARTLASVENANVRAGRLLDNLVTPMPVRRVEVRRPAPVKVLLRYYRRAQSRFGVPWNVLAAINFVESHFGRDLGPSASGALGPMQFLPSTWSLYGSGGDVMSPHDAILAAARYLRASGAPSAMRRALLAYNPSDAYVTAISIYAREMKRSKVASYAYYFWQVFVRTNKGLVQLTGPGRHE